MSTINFTPTNAQAEAVARQIPSKYPTVVLHPGRLAAAVIIASTPGAIDGEIFFGFKVKSQNTGKIYDVDLNRHNCTCPDHAAHGAGGVICKHRLAAYINSQVKPEPAPLPALRVGDIGTVRGDRTCSNRLWPVEVITVNDDPNPWVTLHCTKKSQFDGGYFEPFTCPHYGMTDTTTVRQSEVYNLMLFNPTV